MIVFVVDVDVVVVIIVFVSADSVGSVRDGAFGEEGAAGATQLVNRLMIKAKPSAIGKNNSGVLQWGICKRENLISARKSIGPGEF